MEPDPPNPTKGQGPRRLRRSIEKAGRARLRRAFGSPEQIFLLGLKSTLAIEEANQTGARTANPDDYLARHPEVVPVIRRKAREAAARYAARSPRISTRYAGNRAAIRRTAPRRGAGRAHRSARRVAVASGGGGDDPGSSAEPPDPPSPAGRSPENLAFSARPWRAKAAA